jgi:hypothetical protein
MQDERGRVAVGLDTWGWIGGGGAGGLGTGRLIDGRAAVGLGTYSWIGPIGGRGAAGLGTSHVT